MRITFIFLFFLFLPGLIFADEWHVDSGAENLVEFTSEVLVLKFTGKTSNIDGFVYWEGQEMFYQNNQMHFEVDLNTLETGIGKRDRDMRDVLETQKWQYSTFDGGIKNPVKIDSSLNTYKLTVTGKLFIHGVERDVEAPGTVVIANDGKMHVICDFSINLPDFNIKAPALAAFVKVSNNINLHLDFYLKKAEE